MGVQAGDFTLGFNYLWPQLLAAFEILDLQQQHQTAVSSSKQLPLILKLLDDSSPSPLFLFSGWPQHSVFTQPCFSAFSSVVSDSTISQCLSASAVHPFCHDPSLEFFCWAWPSLVPWCWWLESSSCFWCCFCQPEFLQLLFVLTA